MEPEITLNKAVQHLGISVSYFRQLIIKLKLKSIRHGQAVSYSQETIDTVAEYLKHGKDPLTNPVVIKTITYLENIPAGYVGTITGLMKFIGGNYPRCNLTSVLTDIDTMYEDTLTRRITIIGLTDNHVFITPEVDKETEELIKSCCMTKQEVEDLRNKQSLD